MQRLMLRKPRPSDAETIFNSYARDAEVTRYLVWRPHKDVEETERFVLGCVAAWDGGARFPWVITLREGDEPAGMIEMRINAFKADVGYVLARRYWGRGIAPEALRPLVEWALSQDGIYRVWALCDVENAASARVLEKAGMRREGTLRRNTIHPNIGPEPRDSHCYAAVK